MSPEQQALDHIRAQLAELPVEPRLRVVRTKKALESIVNIAPGEGLLALALLGAEKAAQS